MDAATEDSLRAHFDAWAQTQGATRVESTLFGDRYQDSSGHPAFVVHVVVERDGATSFMHLGGAAFAPIEAQLLDSNDFRVGVQQVQHQPRGAIGRAMVATELGLFALVLEDTRPSDAPPMRRDVYNCLVTHMSS